MNSKPITVPIALSSTRSATITLPWFVQDTRVGSDDKEGKAEFPPMPATYKPLINGEAAFGAIYDAIANAQRCVEIVCWGFQPSMYFRRGAINNGSLCLGELLLRKASQGVAVRVLSWIDNLLISQYSENNLPHYSVLRAMFTQNEDGKQLSYDQQWFGVVKYGAQEIQGMHESRHSKDYMRRMLAFSSVLAPMSRPAAIRTLQNIRFVTRGFSADDGSEIETRELNHRSDKQLDELAIRIAFKHMPTHHQKTVLVDYELPEQSFGFVMGHNMLDAYWDDDRHSYLRQEAFAGRNGATPRQDMSCMITGPLLEYLNVNFCRGWQRATDEDVLSSRMPLAEKLAPRREEGAKVMAQITRTQSQEGRRDIKTLYLQAVNNATNFIYIENQYFRWPPLAEAIKDAARKQVIAGRDPGEHGSIYLFVVTNADKDALANAELSTYRMLASLGRPDTMPTVTRLERGDALQAERDLATQQLNKAELDIKVVRKYGDYGGLLSSAQSRAEDAKEQIAAIDQRIQQNNDASQPVLPEDIPGLKVLLCTLVAPDSPTPWVNTYVHSKIMVVDDVFLTHGSANINTRSMEVDSEINICHECGDVTRSVRERLWDIHTNGLGVGKDGKNCARLDAATVYDKWTSIIEINRHQGGEGMKGTPYAPLAGFYCTSSKRGHLD